MPLTAIAKWKISDNFPFDKISKNYLPAVTLLSFNKIKGQFTEIVYASFTTKSVSINSFSCGKKLCLRDMAKNSS